MVADAAANDKPTVLVDGSSYLFRAFHALPPLTTRDGFPTGAVKGVVAMVRRLVKDYPGSPLAIVFDPKGKTFRDDLYPDYKANRPPTPPELRQQIPPIQEIIKAMGLPLLVVPGFEADDVIGTVAVQAAESGHRVIISTGDKDLAQLVGERITLINTMSDTRMDRAGVVEKFGVPPELIVDYLALMGDAVDNIPGVPKVGPKTAAKWLNQYGSLDAVMAAADEVKGKVGENLRASLEHLPLSRTLATIRCDLQLGLELAALVPAPEDKEALQSLFERYQFNSWLKELRAAPPPPIGERTYECVTTEAALDAWIARLEAADCFAFDTETTSLNYMQADLVGFSFAVKPGEAAYVPVGHSYPGAPAQLPLDLVLGKLGPLLADSGKPKVGHHLKYDINVMARVGAPLAGVAYDTMLESYVLDSTAGRHNMDELAGKYLDVKTTHYKDVAGKGAKQVGFDLVEVAAATDYAAEDADVTLRLHQALWPQLAAEPRLVGVYQDIERPLIQVLSRMERSGALLDGGLLLEHSAQLAGRILALQAQAWELAGGEFNLDSPKQLQEIFYERLGLPQLRKTPKGQPSTAEPVLRELADRGYHQLPAVILDYRALTKLKTTYTDKLPLQIDQSTGRIHTSYHQANAATGRLASSDPNLQNIPIRTPEGRRVREAFCAPPGRRIMAADYSQIELRIMAHLSGDKGLLAAFAENLDVHQATAAEVFGLPLEQVTDEQRRNAKAVNFGLMYGMSAFGLSRQLGNDPKSAQAVIDQYFAKYPRVDQYMQDTRKLAHEQGYVETHFGRRLYLREINARQKHRQRAAERTAINAPLQGTAADIIKRAMLSVDAWLATGAVDALMIMQVHDELVFEVAEGAVDELIAGVRQRMSAAADLSVPLLVDCGVGANWDEAH